MRNKELKEAAVFFIITIFLSYFVFWGPIAFFKVPTVNLVNGGRGPVWAIILFIIGGFVPSITGLILTAVYEGKKGVKELLGKTIQVKIGARWFATVILVSAYFALALIVIYSILGGRFDYSQFLIQLSGIIPLIILGPLSEEYGWRGFAVKRLLNHLNPNLASLITGLIWSLWHLPLFFMLGASQHEFNMPFLGFVVTVTCTSFVYTYVYIRTNRSLFSAIFLHWIYTYAIQVVTYVIRVENKDFPGLNVYNWLECIPALLIGLAFAFMLSKVKTLPGKQNYAA